MTSPLQDPLPAPPPQKKRTFARFFAPTILGLILLGFLAPIIEITGAFAPGPLQQEKTVIIGRGKSTAEIGTQLTQEKAIYLSFFFRLAARLAGPIKAGEYAVPAKASPFEIAILMHEGRSVVRRFTAAEGLTSAEIVDLLNQEPALSGAIDKAPPEGSLLPETYYYSYSDSRTELIARMQKAMQEKMNTLWADREQSLPLKSSKEALALASIIEKETGKPEERPRIAGVFYNRLRNNMRLQSDPTVIYALTNGKNPLDRALTHDDLAVASPINTYASEGIPPQPICNPGRAALEAALHPEHHSFLYFVADGNGGHTFAANLEAHNKNINTWHRKLRDEMQP